MRLTLRGSEGEMKVDKKTVHCPNCDSQNLRLINVVQKWDVETQNVCLNLGLTEQ
jgi:hypothetical protein